MITNYLLNVTLLSFVKFFLIFCNFAISNSFIFLKIFKTICIARFTFDLFPEINMEEWPFGLLKQITNFYFVFWFKLLPTVTISNTGLVMDLSRIVAIESLDGIFFIYLFLSKLSLFNITTIKNLEIIIRSLIKNNTIKIKNFETIVRSLIKT